MKKQLDAKEELGGNPSSQDLDRLVQQYRTYKLPRRQTLPQYFTGRTIPQLVDDRLAALNIDASTLTAKQLGGYRRGAREKVNKAILRILYLRCRIDEGLSRKHANQRLIERYRSQLGKSAIQRATRHAKKDE